MTKTLTNQERLQDLELLHIPKAREAAIAEGAYIARFGDAREWSGSIQKLAELEQEANDLRLHANAERIATASEEFSKLETAIASRELERRQIEDRLRWYKANQVVQRYEGLTALAIRKGAGLSWDLLKPWILSRRTKQFLHPMAAGLANEPDFWFSDSARQSLADFENIKVQLVNARNRQASLHDRRARLLREHPELLNPHRLPRPALTRK